MLNDSVFAADHHAIAALQTPHTAAGAYIDVVNLLRRKLLGSANVVNVVGVAAVDKNVFRFEKRCEAGDRFVHHRCRYHQPNNPRFPQLLDEVLERRRSHRFFADQFFNYFWRPVEDHAFMVSCNKASNHIGAHSS